MIGFCPLEIDGMITVVSHTISNHSDWRHQCATLYYSGRIQIRYISDDSVAISDFQLIAFILETFQIGVKTYCYSRH